TTEGWILRPRCAPSAEKRIAIVEPQSSLVSVALERKSKGACRPLLELPRQRPTLPRRYQRSTIGPGGLNFRVRDGNGCGPSGIATGNRSAIEYVDSRVQPSNVGSLDECNVVKPHGRLVPLS